MKITFAVDQRAALLRGINAPSSTVALDIDPGQLTQAERDLIASCMINGHEATQALKPEGTRLHLVDPSTEGLKQAIAQVLAAREQRAETDARERAEYEQRLIAERDDPTNRHTVTIRVHLDAEGKRASYASQTGVTVEGTVTVPKHLCWPFGPSPDSIAQLNAAAEQEIAAATEALLPQAREMLEAKRADNARVQVEYDSLYRRLPPLLRKRAEEGYAKAGEVTHEIQQLMRADAGYYDSHGYEEYEDAKTLTDHEYAQLLHARKTAPVGSKIELRRVNDTIEHACEHHQSDEYDATCDLCTSTETNRRCIACISWTIGGVTATADLLLSVTDQQVNHVTDYAELASEYARRRGNACGSHV